jgi:hypothetical protein
MKKILLCALFTIFTRSVNAKIWLVDNNLNSPQPITTITAAIDSASAGDTIMVEGSPITYGDIYITKSLTLIGEGYYDNLGENTIVGEVYVRESNVFFTGFTTATGRAWLDARNAPGGALSEVTIERCYFGGILFSGLWPSPTILHNIFIRNNVSKYNIGIAYPGGSITVQFDTLIIENNIFSEPNFPNWDSWVTGTNTVLIRNNNFIALGSVFQGSTLFFDGYFQSHLQDAILSNNIFYGCNPSGSINCTFMNNLTYSNGVNDTLPGPINNNIYSQDPLFVNYPGGPFDFSHDYRLSAGSPCIGAGTGGTDIGITGGNFPFVVGAGPKTPVVDYVNISNTAVPQGSIFYLQFDARIRK